MDQFYKKTFFTGMKQDVAYLEARDLNITTFSIETGKYASLYDEESMNQVFNEAKNRNSHS